MFVKVDENGYVIAKSERKVDDSFIYVEKFKEDPFFYRLVGNKFILDENLKKRHKQQELEEKKRKLSNIITRYIDELLKYFDYDDKADLLLCLNIPIYAQEAQKILGWIEKVYLKYEELLNEIEEIDLDKVEKLLPKYRV